MSDDQDMLLAFRARSDEWADLACAEAKTIYAAIADPNTKSVTAALRRLGLIVEHVRTAGDAMLDALPKLIAEHEDEINPDNAQELLWLALSRSMSCIGCDKSPRTIAVL